MPVQREDQHCLHRAQKPTRARSQLLTSIGGRIRVVEGADPLQELLRASLLEETHERRAQGLSRVRRDLCHGRPRPCTLLDIAARNLPELEVSGDVGGDEDVRELAVRHEQLGDEIDVPIIRAAVFRPRRLALCVVAVLLE